MCITAQPCGYPEAIVATTTTARRIPGPTQTLDGPGAPRTAQRLRVAVLRALPGLGDTLCAVPALRALRERFPTAHITYAGLPSSAWLAERFGDLVDRHWDMPALPGLHPLPARRGTVAATFKALSAEAFDLAIQLHVDGTRSNAYTTAIGARMAVGPGWAAMAGSGRTALSPAPGSGAHEVDRLLAVVTQLGCRPVDRRVRFPVTAADREGMRRLVRRAGRLRPYVVLHPGASRPENRWSLDGFAEVGRNLAPQWRSVVTGTSDEKEIAVSLSSRVPRAVNLAARTSLGELAALLEGAAALVSNDTGTAHLAAALGVPSVVLFLDGDVDRWGPPDGGPHRIVRVRSAGPAPPAPGEVDAVLGALAGVAR